MNTVVCSSNNARVHTLQISWHPSNLEEPSLAHNLPVLSCDFSPAPLDGCIGRLATAGNDKTARLWKLQKASNSEVTCTYLATLSGHDKAVNVVRFCPAGKLLATGSDDGELLLWARDAEREVVEGEEGAGEEVWRVEQRLHLATDCYDISWCVTGAELAAASTDGKVTIFSLGANNKWSRLVELSPHAKYVQGVAWDPQLQFLASSSNDRSVALLGLWARGAARRKVPKLESTSKKCFQQKKQEEKDEDAKEDEEIPEDGGTIKKKNKRKDGKHSGGYFHDDTVPTFFRRLAWSPDGNLLVCPTGRFCVRDMSGSETESALPETEHATHVFTRSSFPHPVVQLPCGAYPSVAVRFSPILYELDADAKHAPVFALPYRMVFAVVSTDACVTIYDTQHAYPICKVAGIHYEPLNDVSWSPDGQYLVVGSTDGYCSVVEFDSAALGKPLSAEERMKALQVLETPYRAALMKKRGAGGNVAEADDGPGTLKDALKRQKVNKLS